MRVGDYIFIVVIVMLVLTFAVAVSHANTFRYGNVVEPDQETGQRITPFLPFVSPEGERGVLHCTIYFPEALGNE